MIGRLLLLGFLMSACLNRVYPQQLQLGLPPIINYTKQDYQAETQNWCVTEDTRGLLYLGNNSGLLEFDGTYWRTFRLPNRSIVRSISADSTGRILVGGQDEMGFFQPDENGFLAYHSLISIIPEAYRNFEDVWEILQTPYGIFWASQKYLFLQNNEAVRVFTTDSRFDGVFYLNDEIYLVVFKEGIKKWTGDDFQLISGGEFFAQKEVICILPHQQDELLITTRDEGLFHFAGGRSLPWATEVSAYLAENSIYCALKLNNGNIALGTSHKGLLMLDEQGRPILSLPEELGLLNNSVLSLHEDRSHNLWVGLENGISYVEISSPFSRINADLGVEGAGYASIVFEDKLYLATNQGVFVREWTYPINGQYPGPGRFELVRDSRGPSWGLFRLGNQLFACKHRGLTQINGNRLERSSPFNGSWKMMELKNHPGFAVEGNYKGLILYEKKAGQSSWTFRSKLNGFSESSRVMEQDENGNIWISHPTEESFV